MVPTVLYTSTHAVSGTLALTERMQDKLSSDLTQYVELTDASIYRISQPDMDPVRAPEVATPKINIALIALDVDERIRMPHSLAKRQPKVGRPGLVITAGIEIRGTVYLGPSRASPAEALGSEDGLFFAVTDAHLRFTASDHLNVHSQVALIARIKVTTLAFI